MPGVVLMNPWRKFLFGILLLPLCLGFSAGQAKQPAILQIQNSGSTAGTAANFFRVNFTSGCTATYSSGAFNIACTGGAGNPGGTPNQLQYNNAGTSFAGFTPSGDVAINVSTGVFTVKGLNGTALSGLSTGLLKNTTSTGAPSIAVLSDITTLFTGTGLLRQAGAASELSGDCTTSGSNAVTCLDTNGTPFTSLATLATTAYSVLVSGASNPAYTTPSANGQCLMSGAANYATTTPSFQTCPSGGGGSLPSGNTGLNLRNTTGSTTYAATSIAGGIDASLYRTGSVGTCTPGTNDNICIANAIAAIPGSPATGGGYAVIDDTNATGAQVWTASPFAAILSNGTTNFTAPVKCGLLILSGGAQITMNQPFAVPRCWDVEVISQFGQLPNIAASSSWPGIYNTGTVTTGSPTLISTNQYQFTVTGSGTTFTSNVVVGEEFAVCQGSANAGANGPSCGGNGTTTCSVACSSNSAGQLTYGIVLAVTDNTHLVVGTANAATGVANASGVNYVIKAPLIWLGAMGAGAADSGGASVHWKGGQFSCANKPGCSGFANFSQQENTTLENVVITNVIDTYVDIEGINAVNSGPYERIVMNGSSSCAAGTMAVISRIPGSTKDFGHFTVNFDACPSTGGATAIDWEQGGELWDAHYENTGNTSGTDTFISVGDNGGGLAAVTCPVICVQPVNSAASSYIHGVAVTGTGGTGVSLGLNQDTWIQLADVSVSFTNVIVDNARSCSIATGTGDSTIVLYEHLYGNGWFGTAQNTVNSCGSGGEFAGPITFNGTTSGSATVGASATGSLLDLNGANATVSAAGAASFATSVTVGSSGAGTVALGSSGGFTSTLGSVATANNTIDFPATVPTTLHGLYCVTSSTTCTLTDTGYAYNAIPISNIGSAGLSGTAPITISGAGAIACATCVTSAASLTNTAIMTGAGSQASQTPDATATLSAGGVLAGVSLAESLLTGSAAQTTITETATGHEVTRAGVETANLTYPYVFTNANTTTTTSGALGINTTGAGGTGQVPLIINETVAAGDLLDAYTGGSFANGVFTAGTKEFTVGSTGILALGTATIPTFGTGAAQELQACGTAPTLVASTSFQYCNASNFFDISTGTTDLGPAVAESSIITANVIPKAIGTNPGLAASTLSDNGTTVSTTEAVAFGSSGQFAVSAAGLVTKSNNLTTAGQGVTPILGVTSQKSETATADANVLTVTPASAAGTYRISVVISVSAATSGVIGWTATYTDSNGNAQTPTELELFQNGTAAPALTFTTSAAGNYHGSADIDVNNAGTNIVIKWIGGGTTTAKMSATVERII